MVPVTFPVLNLSALRHSGVESMEKALDRQVEALGLTSALSLCDLG